jgi:hypothetical protein
VGLIKTLVKGASMTAPFKSWTVLPHGELTKIDDNILTVVGEIRMAVGKLPRRMTIVRLADSRLVIFSAVALKEDDMRRVDDFGTPAFLIVPNEIHRMDAKIWKDRYPKMRVLTPERARSKVQQIVAVDSTSGNFGDPNVVFITVAGTLEHEAALQVTGTLGTTLVLNDLVGNIRNATGFSGWFLRMMKFAGDEPHIPSPVRWKLVSSKAQLREQLLEWAAIPGLKRILVSHGAIIDQHPSDVLRNLANSLT